ncbi:MAG: LysR family transcriptional regulator, partial [Aestuariivirgaceae bacterium]
MLETDLRNTDLNLLIVLHSLLHTRSVTKTAGRLNMSQPAVSRALAKLRATFDDKLFVKAAGGMLPTTRAQELMAPLATSLDVLHDLFARPEFDPA